ncbi:hypothetical protein ACP3CK_004703, partial [Escherichia coli]
SFPVAHFICAGIYRYDIVDSALGEVMVPPFFCYSRFGRALYASMFTGNHRISLPPGLQKQAEECPVNWPAKVVLMMTFLMR